MKRLLLLVWVAATAAAAAGGEEALPDGREMPPAWSSVPGRAEEGKVAFMGFDFGQELEWEPEVHEVFDAWPGSYLARKFALETPWHGFESVEAWGDVETRLPMALVFERNVPDGSMEDAERWMEEMVPAFPEECGMELRRQDCGGPCLEARGMKGGLVAWVCAGRYSLSRPVGKSDSGLPVWETEEGVSYQVRIRHKEGRIDSPETPDPLTARFLALYRAFLDAPSERTLLDLLVDAVDVGSPGPPPPEICAFLLEQLSQDPPPVYRVDLGDAPEIDAWTVVHACAESLFSGIPSALLPALRAAIAGPATPE